MFAVALYLCVIGFSEAASHPGGLADAAGNQIQYSAPVVAQSQSERGFSSQLWRRFGPAARRVRPEAESTTLNDSLESLQARGLAPSEAMLAPRFFDSYRHVDHEAATPDSNGSSIAVRESFGDWQQAAMNSSSRAVDGSGGAGPSMTVLVVAVASFIVLIGTFLMPR